MKLKTFFNPKIYPWAFRYYKKHALKNLGYYWAKIRGKNYFDININGTKLKLFFSHPYHYLIAKHLSRNEHEYALLAAWQEEAKKADTILDVGSYNGIYALVAKAVNKKARVIEFEPEPVNIEHILENMKQNNLEIEMFDGVISANDGVATFSPHEGGTGGFIGKGDEIPATKLDSVPMGSKILIKLDIEGAEYDVLKAAPRTLKKDVTILLEVHKEFIKKYGHTAEELYELIQEAGYRLLWLDENSLTVHYWMCKKYNTRNAMKS